MTLKGNAHEFEDQGLNEGTTLEAKHSNGMIKTRTRASGKVSTKMSVETLKHSPEEIARQVGNLHGGGLEIAFKSPGIFFSHYWYAHFDHAPSAAEIRTAITTKQAELAAYDARLQVKERKDNTATWLPHWSRSWFGL
ncbi:MAG: hypothetical protein IPL79_16305 [Myxococcales bacterium]|nr:hypothetical protein [Myxococcales bacterium]